MKPGFFVSTLRSGQGLKIQGEDGGHALLFVRKVHDEADRVQILIHSPGGRVMAERSDITLQEFTSECHSTP